MNIPDEFGLFPFQRFTADELRHFFVWCAAHKVSDVDLTGGSPVSVSRFGRRVRCSSATLPTTLMSSLIDELFGREVIPAFWQAIRLTGRYRLTGMHPGAMVLNAENASGYALTSFRAHLVRRRKQSQ